MENNSHPPFHVRQKVVALVNGTTTDMKKDKVYIVYGMIYCCGHWIIDVGLNSDEKYAGVRCAYCHKTLSNGSPRWIDVRFFAPYNPPRHVEIAEDILKIVIIEERADTPKRVLND